MPLHVKAWSARMFCSGGMIYLPFDQNFKPERPEFDNHMPLSKVGNKTSWYIFVEFPPLDPQDASYPHYVELPDNEDFTTFKFEAHWSEKAGLQNGYGPVPTAVGKHRVRLVVLNRDQKPLLSQSGDYYIDIG